MFHTISPHSMRKYDPISQTTKDSDVVWLNGPVRSRHSCGWGLSTSDTLHPYASMYCLILAHRNSKILGEYYLCPCLINTKEMFEPAADVVSKRIAVIKDRAFVWFQESAKEEPAESSYAALWAALLLACFMIVYMI